MDYGETCAPSRLFRGIIEGFWFSEIDAAGEKTFEILPDGNFDLIFILRNSCCSLLFAGPYTRTAVMPICAGKYFGVRFRPGKMPNLADIQPAELVDHMVQLPRMSGESLDFLGEGLMAAEGMEARRALVESIFHKIGLELSGRRTLSDHCTDLITSCHGRIKVHELARRVGTSVRTLERVFVRNLGVSPKLFIRLVRLQHAVARLKDGAAPSLTELAYMCGYADQSHFIKDFKEMVGRVPSKA